MRKTRIKVSANIVRQADTHKAARLVADDCHDVTIIITDSNNEANIDFANVDLIEFGVYTKTLLADSIQKTRRRWAVEDYTNSNKINVIILLIMNLEAESTNYMKDFLLICRC